jgi:hypothetical protein
MAPNEDGVLDPQTQNVLLILIITGTCTSGFVQYGTVFGILEKYFKRNEIYGSFSRQRRQVSKCGYSII